MNIEFWLVSGEDSEVTEEKSLQEEIDQVVDEDRVLRSILISISKYATFLIEENVKDVINNFSPADQVIVRLDKILSVIYSFNLALLL